MRRKEGENEARNNFKILNIWFKHIRTSFHHQWLWYGSTQASTRFSPLTAPITNGARLTKTKTVLYTAVAYKNWALYSFHYQWCQPGSHKNCLQYNFHHQWCHSVQYKKWLQYSSHFQLCLSVKHKILLAVQLPFPMMPFWPKLHPGLDGSEQELSAVQLLFPMKPLWLSHEPPSIQLSSPIWCQSAADKIWENTTLLFPMVLLRLEQARVDVQLPFPMESLWISQDEN